MTTHEINYTSGPTFEKFHASAARRRGVMGPIGSGKSTGMCMEIFRRGQQQALGPDGIARTRWVVVRNTYRELRDTTVKTWLYWFPEHIFGDFNYGNMEHMIRLPGVETEVLFRALDRPQDIAKLLSLEITGAWVNEARELPFGVIKALDDRAGRYPPVKDGGCTWAGLMMDTNPPDDDHWWYRLAEEERPEGWEFFSQPGGLIERGGQFLPNPEAENLQYLEPPGAFYTTRAQGASKEYTRVYYCGRYGFVQDGKPVYPEYADDIHAWKDPIAPLKDQPLYVGIDFGLTPAALFAQKTPSGRWLWIDELVTEDMGATRFAELLGPKLRGEYQGYEIHIFGDPAGDQRAQTDETTPFQILRGKGIDARPAPTNDWLIRRDALGNPMTRLIDGLPGFVVSPKCHIARKALAGGYCLKRMQISGEERYRDAPIKNRYSHIVEAGQYCMLGAGEGDSVVGYKEPWVDEYQDETGRSAVTGY